MPVPLNGGSGGNNGSSSLASSKTSEKMTSHTSTSSLNSTTNYIRHQGLNNSNTSTATQRAKMFLPTSTTTTTTTTTTTNTHSFSKLKAASFNSHNKYNSDSSRSESSSSGLTNANSSLTLSTSSASSTTVTSPSAASASAKRNFFANLHVTSVGGLNTKNKTSPSKPINRIRVNNLSESHSLPPISNNDSKKSSMLSSASSQSSTSSLHNASLTTSAHIDTEIIEDKNKMNDESKKSTSNTAPTMNSSTVSSSSASSPSCSSPTSNRIQMPFKIRSSKYRHVYGNAHKEDVCYKNIKITKNAAHDSAFCAVNPKFVAVVTEECGGGAFIVIPIKQTGRIDINTPKVSGHRGPVLDLKWNPFNDNEIASCSEDATIKVWQIGDHGLYENLNEWVVDLHGHQRKVGQIEWHPTAENIMVSSGADFQVILWNLEKAEPIRIITCHNDTIQSLNWNRDGSILATTCKDKKIRIIDPRTGALIAQGDGHQGSKISKVVILGCGTKLFTTGFSKLSERQIALWNIKDLSKPVQMDVVDCSSGILIPYYDHDTKIVFVAGKGDGNIRYYEITDSEPYIHYLSEYKSSTPQRGLGSMPKRGLDCTKNEIFRFYKLHATGGICEPISMIVPRKSEVFQEDIYPDTASGIPSLSCDEWIAGENRDPILISMKDSAMPFMPKIITYKQLGFSELGPNYNRTISKPIKQTKSMNDSPNMHNYRKAINGYVENIEETNNQSKKLITRNSFNNSSHQPNQSHSKLVLSSKSAFNKMSSSSTSSSPPTSPNTIKFTRLQSETHVVVLETSTANNSHLNDDQSPDVSLNGTITTNNTSDNNNASSNESMSNDESNYKSNTKVKPSEDLEATYITSVSKNPITLRKTESLKLDSVQTIRNRFNRMNTNNVPSLNRNPQVASRNIEQLNDYLNNSNEAINQHSNTNGVSKITISSSSSSTSSSSSATNDNDHGSTSVSPPSPPTFIVSPLAYSNTMKTPTPTLMHQTQNQGTNNGLLTNGEYSMTSGCVKKRVWTPVQTTNQKLISESGLNGTHTNFSELQKSYFRLLEEKNNLKEQLSTQEKRNKELEEELLNKDKHIEALNKKLSLYLNDDHLKKIADYTSCSLVEATDC